MFVPLSYTAYCRDISGQLLLLNEIYKIVCTFIICFVLTLNCLRRECTYRTAVIDLLID